MKRIVYLPRIIKINWIKELSVSVVFNNGESRVIDFRKTLKKLSEKEPNLAVLMKPEEFAKVTLVDTTLSWSNVELFMPDLDGRKIRIPFEIGADTLFEMSKPDKSLPVSRIGRLIREARKKSGLTQQQLAKRSGTTRNYISRIENDRSGIELDTLRKIIEIGLGKKMVLDIV